MSGVVPTDKCKEEFTLLKNSRTYKFIVFKIDDDGKYVDVHQTHKTSVSLAAVMSSRTSLHPRHGAR
jgi:hypothetical protein